VSNNQMIEGFYDTDSERSVLGSVLLDPDLMFDLEGQLEPGDFFQQAHAWIYEAMLRLWHNNEPIDSYGINDELRIAGHGGEVTPGYVAGLIEYVPSAMYWRTHAPRVKRHAWMRRFLRVAQEVTDLHGDGATIDDLFAHVQSALTAMTPAPGDDALLRWQESFAFYDNVLSDRARESDAGPSPWAWPWSTWQRLLGNLEAGLLCMVAAGDGMGKTAYLENIAEQWARKGGQVAFVHFELNRKVMLDRRTARHARVPMWALQTGKLTEAQRIARSEADVRLAEWTGNLHYLYTPGWSMQQVIRTLEHMCDSDGIEAAVIDYVDKASSTPAQLRQYGANKFAREADDVEQLKVFAERKALRMVTATQITKLAKAGTAGRLSRSDMRGAGEKSEKSNVVVLLHRDRAEGGETDAAGKLVVEPGGYSRTVQVRIDKNTLGPTGDFQQMMIAEHFAVTDLEPTL